MSTTADGALEHVNLAWTTYPYGGPLGESCALVFLPEGQYSKGRFFAKCETGASAELKASFAAAFPSGEGRYSFVPKAGALDLYGMNESGVLTLTYAGQREIVREIFSGGSANITVVRPGGDVMFRLQDTWTEAGEASKMCPAQLLAPTLDAHCESKWSPEKSEPVSAEWSAQQCRFDYSCHSPVGKQCEHGFKESWVHTEADDCLPGLACVDGRSSAGKKICVPQAKGGEACGSTGVEAACMRGYVCHSGTCALRAGAACNGPSHVGPCELGTCSEPASSTKWGVCPDVP